MGREDGNSGILLSNEKYLSFEVLSFLPSQICTVPAGIEPPHPGTVLVSSVEQSGVYTLQHS